MNSINQKCWNRWIYKSFVCKSTHFLFKIFHTAWEKIVYGASLTIIFILIHFEATWVVYISIFFFLSFQNSEKKQRISRFFFKKMYLLLCSKSSMWMALGINGMTVFFRLLSVIYNRTAIGLHTSMQWPGLLFVQHSIGCYSIEC